MNEKQFAVYILANSRPTLYVGVTNNLYKRIYQHKTKADSKSFTARYNINKLVYFEIVDNATSAIIREKQIKNLSRSKRIELIKRFNPLFKDLYKNDGIQIPDKPV